MIHPLDKAHPTALLSIFIVLFACVFGHMSQAIGNVIMRMLIVLTEQTMTESPEYKKRILKSLPVDTRTVTKLFNIQAETITYAACPNCAHLYRMSDDSGKPINLTRCTGARFSKVCNAKLMVFGAKDGKTIKIPRKPYVVQSFDAFLGRILCRPGMEELLEASTTCKDKHELWDIMDGRAASELKGHDNQPFLSKSSGELRLAWALSIDWFKSSFLSSTAFITNTVVKVLVIDPMRYLVFSFAFCWLSTSANPMDLV